MKNLHLLFLIITFFILVEIPLALCDNDNHYSDCNSSFDCGGHKGLSYPFWGNDRPDYCGHPGFQLNCQANNVTIEIDSGSEIPGTRTRTYRVLDINNDTEVLEISRFDFLHDLCHPMYYNTTLNFSLYTYASGYKNVTFFYDCPIAIPANPALIMFDCTTQISYFVPSNEIHCNHNIFVPIVEALSIGSQDLLISAIQKGFKVKWAVNHDKCSECVASSGVCGFNNSTNDFTCFCRDRPYTDKCSSGKKIDNAGRVGIGVGVGALVTILIASSIIYIRRRRRDTKSLPPPATISKNLSPDPFSKMDLEKGSKYFGAHVFTHEELEEATDSFNPSKELGDGGFGAVYLGKLKDGRLVAVKRLYENNYKRVEQFLNEVEILTRLNHPNLVTLYGCTSRRSRELLLVYEYIPNGTVADHLHGDRAKSGPLSWSIRMNIALETASALAYLHVSDVIHRDVKTNNILLDNDFRVKVADFGLSRLFPTDVTHVSTAPQGTPGYVDPEYHQCYQLTDKSDVYSFGVVLIELISSLPAVDVNRHRSEINLASMALGKIQNDSLHELVDPSLGFEENYAVKRMATMVAELAFKCLQFEREMRPTMNEVLETLRGIESEDYSIEKAEVVDIHEDKVGILKNIPPPLSPDSVTDKWTSRSTTPSTSN